MTKVLALAALVLGVSASSGAAASPTRVPMLGVVPHASPLQAFAAPHALSAGSRFAGPSLLTFDANYQSLINRYFADVAHDSGGAANVYSVATQYGDGSGSVQYQSAVGGSYVARDPLPANGCDDGADSICLTDPQLQAEIQHVLTTKGWHGSQSSMFFVMTPRGVGSCFDNFTNQCTTNTYCAYHNSFTDSSNEPVIYANQPYDATIDGCDSGSSPNGGDADAEINTISHEHNEAVTNPFGTGWYEGGTGAENGDLCAWKFGNPLTPGGDYNQVIDGNHYWLQQEYSNIGSDCFQNATQEHGPTGNTLGYHGGPVMHTNTTYAIYWLPTPGNIGLPEAAGPAGVNRTLTSSPGSWTASPTGYSYQWTRCSAAGAGCVGIPGATAATYGLTSADVGHTIRSSVRATNVNGTSALATSAATAVVVSVPASTAAPKLSGAAGVSRLLSTTAGSWNSAVTLAYQWLRCAADGSGCAPIAGATASAHVLTRADAGHTLEARVSATNAAGTTAALSNRSAVVVARPASRKAPHVSGRAKVGRKLSGSHGAWTNSPTTYRYQWLRCNGHGGSCTAIGRATHTTYRLTKHDTGHRLRIRVRARNIAGSVMATSASSRRVAG